MSKVSSGWVLECIECREQSAADTPSFSCVRCKNLLQLVRKGGKISKKDLFLTNSEYRSVWWYRKALPFRAERSP